jgi:nickel/cobalt transporter (NicO) family protein
MTPLLLTYATALLLGSLHALEADHMAAVTSFAVRRPGPRAAVRFAVRWSAGHGGAIILIGAGLLILGVQLPVAAEHWLERLVGVVMIGLGVWTFRGASALHAHTHAHGGEPHAHLHAHGQDSPRGEDRAGTHIHAHAPASADTHSHAVTGVGLVHGLAGSGAAVALIPIIGFDSPARGILYLVIFAVGTVLAMAVYGLFAGFVVGRSAESSVRLGQLLARGTGVLTVVIGFVWLVR